MAVALVGIGLILLYVGDGGRRPLPLVVGMPMILIGVLFSAPIAIQGLARLAPRLPIAGRLALRDLARYQARSGAALAAISLALGIPVGVVVTAAAEESQTMTTLSDSQLLFRVGDADSPMLVPVRSGETIAALDGRVQAFAATLTAARVLPLDQAVNPNLVPDQSLGDGGGRWSAMLLWQEPGDDRAHGIPLVVATPDLMERFGGGMAVDAHEVYFRAAEGTFRVFTSKANGFPVADRGEIPSRKYGSLPEAFISPTAARSHGWVPTRSGWVVEVAKPLTAAQRRAAQDLAIEAGMTVETIDKGASLAALRTGATAGGMLLALGVLA